MQTTHPGTIQLDGDTATGRAYIQELARARDGRQGLNYAIYHSGQTGGSGCGRFCVHGSRDDAGQDEG